MEQIENVTLELVYNILKKLDERVKDLEEKIKDLEEIFEEDLDDEIESYSNIIEV